MKKRTALQIFADFLAQLPKGTILETTWSKKVFMVRPFEKDFKFAYKFKGKKK